MLPQLDPVVLDLCDRLKEESGGKLFLSQNAIAKATQLDRTTVKAILDEEQVQTKVGNGKRAKYYIFDVAVALLYNKKKREVLKHEV